MGRMSMLEAMGVVILAGATGLAGCGRKEETSSPKVVGGTAVSSTDAITKSTVALVDPEGNQFCTGSLISARKVVTAAHCLEGYTEDYLFVSFGPMARLGHFTQEKLRWAVSGKVHEDFSEWAMVFESGTPNDIAQIELNADAPEGFVPVAVLGNRDSLYVGERLVLAGFGLTHYRDREGGELRKVTSYVDSKNGSGKEFTFGRSPGRSACMGDSGGPAFVYRSGKLVLVGVTSRGSSRCDSDGIYTDLRYFRTWLGMSAAR